MSDSGFGLSSKITPPLFDVSRGGNIRKSIEAESAYICCVICASIRNDSFTGEFKKLANGYNYIEIVGSNSKDTFGGLLKSWLDLQFVIINIIVSAAKDAITTQKKRFRAVLEGGLVGIQLAGLRDLALDIKSIYLVDISTD